MNAVRTIRERLGVTQAALGAALGMTQGNVHFYEKGQTVPPDVAKALIAYARRCGLAISYEHIYDGAELPAPSAADSKTEA